MAERSPGSGLRYGIDAACDELGTQIVEDIPGSASELRAELCDFDVESAVESDDVPELQVQKVLDDSPFDQYLDVESLVDPQTTNE